MQCKFVQIIEETKKLDFTQQVTYYFDNILLVGINLAHHHQLASMRQFTGCYSYNERNIICHINTTDLTLKWKPIRENI